MDFSEKITIVHCEDCTHFDDTDYCDHDPEMPELRAGWCSH